MCEIDSFICVKRLLSESLICRTAPSFVCVPSYMCHDSFTWVTSLIHTCDTTHSYVCDMPRSYVQPDPCIRRIFFCSYEHDPFIRQPIHTTKLDHTNMTDSYEHDPFIRTRPMNTNMTHLYEHDPFIRR